MAAANTGRSMGWPLVGRAAEFARAAVLLEEVAQGRGRVLLVSGPAGIGKSRLAGEILTLAAQRGFVTLAGGARVLGQGLAYAPLLEAIGPHLAGLEPGPRVRLVDGLADLGRLFADLHLPPAPALGDPALERTRLFEAVARMLGRLAARAPVVLAVDDLHYVARGIGAHRLLLLGAYRSDEVVAATALQVLVRDLRRAGLSAELDLPGLTSEPIRSLAAAVLGEVPPQPLVEALVERAAGSPLVVTALIAELVAGGALFRSGGTWVLGPGALDLVPAVVRDLVVERLRRLPVEERAVLELVALAGEAALPPVLADALDVDEGMLLERLRALADAGLAVETVRGPEVVYRTSHPLYAEVAGAELGEAARRRLHARIAAALERHRGGDPVLLAPHYRGAVDQVDPRRAVEVLVAAGERALNVQAGAEAARYLVAAQTHAATLGDEHRTAEILERLGEAEQSAGRADAATTVWKSTRAAYERLDDPGGIARVCRRLAMLWWEQGQAEEALAIVAEGLATSAPHTELIRLREVRVRMLGRMDALDAVEAEADELLALGTRHGLPRVVAYANLCRTYRQKHRGEYEQIRHACRDAIAAAEPVGDLLVADNAYRQLASVELALGRHRQARSVVQTALRALRNNGISALEHLSLGMLGWSAYLAGDWDNAQRFAAEAVSQAHRVGSARGVATGLAIRGVVLGHRGDLAGASACLAEGRARFGGYPADRHVVSLMETIEGVIAFERGNPEQALAIVDGHATDVLTFASFQLAALGEIRLAAGRPDAALAVAAQIERLHPGAPYLVALAARLTGLVAHERGDTTTAQRELRRAEEGFSEVAVPFEVARCGLAWAQAAAAEHPQEAAAAAQESLTGFTALGARRFADRSRGLLRELGVRPAPARRRDPPTGGLSRREAEVVRLVAEGLSNAEVARRLVISPRTVTTHLQHVYARLGLRSRVALVRYATEHDLLGPAGDSGAQPGYVAAVSPIRSAADGQGPHQQRR